MELYDAIKYKGLAKSFNMELLEERLLDNIRLYVKNMSGLDGTKNDLCEILTYEEMKQKNTMNFDVKAPYYFIASIHDVQDGMINAGYLLGQFLLYLTSKEISTNILGVEKIKSEDTYYTAILAFGRTTTRMKYRAKAVRNLRSEKYYVYRQEARPEIKQVIRAGGYAPTGLIFQPYRFVLSSSHFHVIGKREAIMTKHQKMMCYFELGMMLSYMQLRAEEMWMDLTLQKRSVELGKNEKNYFYMITAQLKSQV